MRPPGPPGPHRRPTAPPRTSGRSRLHFVHTRQLSTASSLSKNLSSPPCAKSTYAFPEGKCDTQGTSVQECAFKIFMTVRLQQCATGSERAGSALLSAADRCVAPKGQDPYLWPLLSKTLLEWIGLLSVSHAFFDDSASSAPF